ncbi:MAG: flagellar biosynthetic protein FliO [Gammaproteobacteria bacterium]|nr:flagellar biosynthetic protein FliO [Gammaproteobacteria bacterium]
MPPNVPPAAADMAAGGLPSMLGSLILVLALIFALAWLLRRVQTVRGSAPGLLRVRAGLQVGPKERVLLIQAGDRHLLIGVAAGQVSTLHVFAQPPAAAEAPPAAPPGSFAERLRQALGGGGAP